MKRKSILPLTLIILTLAACGNDPGDRALSGAGIGAGAGAVGGALIGGDPLLGAALGAGGGAAIGAATSPGR